MPKRTLMSEDLPVERRVQVSTVRFDPDEAMVLDLVVGERIVAVETGAVHVEREVPSTASQPPGLVPTEVPTE